MHSITSDNTNVFITLRWQHHISRGTRSADDKLTHGQPSHSSTPCRPEHVSAYPWRSLQQNRHRQITTVRQVCIHSSEVENVIGYTASWKWRRMRSPQMMSSVHLVMYGHTSKPLDPTSFRNLLIRISLFSENTSRKLSRILKWKAGVIIFLRVCHFSPGESRIGNYEINMTFLIVLQTRVPVPTLKRNNYLIINP